MEGEQRWRDLVVESGDQEGAGEQQEYGRRLGCLERICQQVADTVKRVSHADSSRSFNKSIRSVWVSFVRKRDSIASLVFCRLDRSKVQLSSRAIFVHHKEEGRIEYRVV